MALSGSRGGAGCARARPQIGSQPGDAGREGAKRYPVLHGVMRKARRCGSSGRLPQGRLHEPMTNNDVLRSLRYALDLGNATVLACFAEVSVELAPEHLAALLKNENEPGFEPMPDELLAAFLDGFVQKRRGKREGQDDGQPRRGDLTNNRILRSLRIALELKDTDILEIMELAGVSVSKAELNALFRREDHRNYQACGNQFLRNFMRGLALRYRSA
jgi:uncharacterized protein YehS (DUF1456 family)